MEPTITYLADQKNLLLQPFAFYGFSLQLNEEQASEVVEKTFAKVLTGKIFEKSIEIMARDEETNAVRRMTKELKKNEEKSYKEIDKWKSKFFLA